MATLVARPDSCRRCQALRAATPAVHQDSCSHSRCHRAAPWLSPQPHWEERIAKRRRALSRHRIAQRRRPPRREACRSARNSEAIASEARRQACSRHRTACRRRQARSEARRSTRKSEAIAREARRQACSRRRIVQWRRPPRRELRRSAWKPEAISREARRQACGRHRTSKRPPLSRETEQICNRCDAELIRKNSVCVDVHQQRGGSCAARLPTPPRTSKSSICAFSGLEIQQMEHFGILCCRLALACPPARPSTQDFKVVHPCVFCAGKRIQRLDGEPRNPVAPARPPTRRHPLRF